MIKNGLICSFPDFLICSFCLFVAGSGCAGAPATAPRVATFQVDEKQQAFTLTIEDPGERPRKIAGDARGTPIPEAQRVELVRWLESHIERLESMKSAEGDVRWMRRFRDAYDGAAARPAKP